MTDVNSVPLFCHWNGSVHYPHRASKQVVDVWTEEKLVLRWINSLEVGLFVLPTTCTLNLMSLHVRILRRKGQFLESLTFFFFSFSVVLFFWPCHVACGILVPQPGIELMSPAVEAWSPNHWTAREFPGKPYVLSAAFCSSWNLSILKGLLKFVVLTTDFWRIIWSPPCFCLSFFLKHIFCEHHWKDVLFSSQVDNKSGPLIIGSGVSQLWVKLQLHYFSETGSSL